MVAANSPTKVEGIELSELAVNPGRKIPWSTASNRAMYQHLARHRVTKKTARWLFMDELLVRLNCAFEGEFRSVVTPKIVSSLEYKIHKLHKEGVLVYDLLGQDVWPEWTARWADDDWNGDISAQHHAPKQLQEGEAGEEGESTSFGAEPKKTMKQEAHGAAAAVTTTTGDAADEYADAEATTLVTPYSPEVEMRDADEEYVQPCLQLQQPHASMETEMEMEGIVQIHQPIKLAPLQQIEEELILGPMPSPSPSQSQLQGGGGWWKHGLQKNMKNSKEVPTPPPASSASPSLLWPSPRSWNANRILRKPKSSLPSSTRRQGWVARLKPPPPPPSPPLDQQQQGGQDNSNKSDFAWAGEKGQYQQIPGEDGGGGERGEVHVSISQADVLPKHSAKPKTKTKQAMLSRSRYVDPPELKPSSEPALWPSPALIAPRPESKSESESEQRQEEELEGMGRRLLHLHARKVEGWLSSNTEIEDEPARHETENDTEHEAGQSHPPAARPPPVAANYHDLLGPFGHERDGDGDRDATGRPEPVEHPPATLYPAPKCVVPPLAAAVRLCSNVMGSDPVSSTKRKPASPEPTATAAAVMGAIEATAEEEVKIGMDDLKEGLKGGDRGEGDRRASLVLLLQQNISECLDLSKTVIDGHVAALPEEGREGERQGERQRQRQRQPALLVQQWGVRARELFARGRCLEEQLEQELKLTLVDNVIDPEQQVKSQDGGEDGGHGGGLVSFVDVRMALLGFLGVPQGLDQMVVGRGD